MKKYDVVKGPGAVLLVVALLSIVVAAGHTLVASDGGSGGGELFIKSGVEHPDGTVTLPLYRGTSHGQNVYYVILDTSDGNMAQSLGINRSQKLANARNTAAVQKVTVNNGVVDFPATVDFRPDHILTVQNGAFPPTFFQPGASGEPGYSPLIQMPNGTIVNAPQLAEVP